MKAIYINPFLEATSYILSQFQLESRIGSPSIQSTPFSGKEIVSTIGITGEACGQIYLGIPQSTALNIVSMMMGGLEVKEFDAMSQSAICELNNMICGNAMTRLASQGVVLNITPPALIYGQNLEITAVKMRVLSIPVSIEGMDALEMNIIFDDMLQ